MKDTLIHGCYYRPDQMNGERAVLGITMWQGDTSTNHTGFDIWAVGREDVLSLIEKLRETADYIERQMHKCPKCGKAGEIEAIDALGWCQTCEDAAGNTVEDVAGAYDRARLAPLEPSPVRVTILPDGGVMENIG